MYTAEIILIWNDHFFSKHWKAKIDKRLTKIMFELNIMSNKSYDKFSKWEKLNFVILETGIFFGFIEN